MRRGHNSFLSLLRFLELFTKIIRQIANFQFNDNKNLKIHFFVSTEILNYKLLFQIFRPGLGEDVFLI